ncbi:MAG: hypothetical protein V4539_19390 [Bacteroidota bacterium]
MLTQSRLMPDLSGLFETKAPVTETFSYFPIPITGQVKTGAAYWHEWQAIRRRKYAASRKPPVYTNNNFARNRTRKKPLARNRPTIVDKLYLVFCQWKTEG